MLVWSLTLLVLLTCTQLIRSERRCCEGLNECFTNDPPFDKFVLPQCLDEVQPKSFLFYRGSPSKGVRINSPSVIPNGYDVSKRTIFLVHGFLQQSNSYWLIDLRKAILKRYNVNVIVTGWSDGSQTLDYWQAAASTRTVGAWMALIAKNLVSQRGAARADLWCVGHSLGSHICGHMGSRIKLGRATGLDPAGPLFDDSDIKCGIHPGAADYVDNIHTMGREGIILDFGTLRPRGHADFYPNGGKVQPGCINYLNVDTLINKYVDISPVCSHVRAIDYFEESVKGSCTFWARQQCSNEKNIPGSCVACGNQCHIQGYESDRIGRAGKFYLTTNSEEPFCKG